MSEWIRILSIVCLWQALVPGRIAGAQGFDLQFNADGVLPSAQLAQYVGGPAESAVYAVTGGILYQNTLPFPFGTSYYLLSGTYNQNFPATFEWRVRVGHNEGQAVIASVANASRGFTFNIANYGLEWAGTCGGWCLVVPMETRDAFHTYRVVIPAGGGGFQIFVDGVLRYNSLSSSAGGGDSYFGDGGPSGGNGSAEWDYITLTNPVTTYDICVLYDQTKVHRSGSAVPIKLQLCKANGTNASSADIEVRAVSVMKVSNSAIGPPVDEGNANADHNFRYDPTLGQTGGYIFNLSTAGYETGTYQLNLTAGLDPATHSVLFQVR